MRYIEQQICVIIMYLIWFLLGIYYGFKAIVGMFVLNNADIYAILIIISYLIILPSVFIYFKMKKTAILILSISFILNIVIGLLFFRDSIDWTWHLISYISPLLVLLILAWCANLKPGTT